MRLAAESPTITEVIASDTGVLFDAAEIIGNDPAALICLRAHLEQQFAAGKATKYVCPVCYGPLTIRSHAAGNRFYFRHKAEAFHCPLSQQSEMNRESILAAKYLGQREGEAHRRLKALVHDSLLCDSRFDGVELERTWRGESDARRWRRPDVSARFNGDPIAFEIQLSTTFVSVMAERRQFYLDHGALLVWIVANFSLEWARLAVKDIFYPNNNNIFVANGQTLDASRQHRHFSLEAHWTEPVLRADGSVHTIFQSKLVDFGELTRDVATQRTFYFDTDEAQARLHGRQRTEPLRRAFEKHWFAYLASDNESWAYVEGEWRTLRRRFAELGIPLPTSHAPLIPLLNTLYSVREAHTGKLVGWKYRNLVELGHHLYSKHKSILWPFRLALAAYGRRDMIRSCKGADNWMQKVPGYLRAIRDGEPEYQPAADTIPLIRVLFPPIADDLAIPPRDFLIRELRGRGAARSTTAAIATHSHESHASGAGTDPTRC